MSWAGSQSDQIENTADVEIQNLYRGAVWSWLKRPAPCCSGIRDQYVNTFLSLPYLCNNALNFARLGDVG